MNMNAKALANSARGFIKLLNTKKTTTIGYVVKDWNICVEQSGFTGTFDFPTTGYTRKAYLIADLERCANQLDSMVYADEVEQILKEEKHEVMVQDIKKGMVVMNPCRIEDKQTVVSVDDFSCYFIITFSGDMAQQYFDRGETLIVCEPVNGSQINNVIPSIEQESETMTDLNANAVINELTVDTESGEVSNVIYENTTNEDVQMTIFETNAINACVNVITAVILAERDDIEVITTPQMESMRSVLQMAASSSQEYEKAARQITEALLGDRLPQSYNATFALLAGDIALLRQREQPNA